MSNEHIEQLHRAIEDAVLRGDLPPAQKPLVYSHLKNHCEVDPKANAIFCKGVPIPDAVADTIKTFDLKPKAPVTTEADALAKLQADALTGNVSSHGALYKQMGEAAYNKWREANRAQPGKDASNNSVDVIAEMERTLAALKAGKVVASPVKIDGVDPTHPSRNPWRASNWNLTRQGAIVRSLGVEKANEIARAAGSFVGATKPAA